MRALRKLSPTQVVRIRQMRREGFTRWFIAQSFGISLHSLHCILSNSTYKDVKQAEYLLCIIKEHVAYYRALAGHGSFSAQSRARHQMLEQLWLKLSSVALTKTD